MTQQQIEGPSSDALGLGRRVRQRSLISQLSTALLQPVYFFRTLPNLGETRQWLWVALLVLGLIGFSAVRQQALAGSLTPDGTITPITDDFGAPFDDGSGGDLGGVPGGDFGIPPGDDFGSPLPDGGLGTGGTGGSAAAVTDTLTTGVIAASRVLLGWVILSVLLGEVSLLRGKAPRIGRNFQIAVWASLPLALMALIQTLYWGAGGTPGQAGVGGLLAEWDGFLTQPPLMQALLVSVASLLTVFWLWSLMMIYFGARFALDGRRWASLLVVLSWLVFSVVAPVATGIIPIPEPVAAEEILDEGIPGELPFDPGELPFDPSQSGDLPFDDDSAATEELLVTEEVTSEAVTTEAIATEATADDSATEAAPVRPGKPPSGGGG
ncbi:MAG: YIP1 family protein [Armatimonadetes bacterium]|nr:YIP1 family protein [Anaerolineae bacterium]